MTTILRPSPSRRLKVDTQTNALAVVHPPAAQPDIAFFRGEQEDTTSTDTFPQPLPSFAIGGTVDFPRRPTVSFHFRIRRMLGLRERAALGSRRPKLDSIPPDHLLLIARSSAFLGNDHLRVGTAQHVTKLLTNAAARGSEEAAWLLGALTNHGTEAIPEFINFQERRKWWSGVVARVAGECPRIAKEYGEIVSAPDHVVDGSLHRAAEGGFRPEQFAQRLCPYALFESAEEKSFALLEAAARLGHPRSMELLVWSFARRLGSLTCAMLQARFLLYSGHEGRTNEQDVFLAVERLVAGASVDANDLQLMYVVGKELDVFEDIWHESILLGLEYLHCVGVYLRVTHRARRAALQTAIGLVAVVGRDVAGLIARCVYQTRSEAEAWWCSEVYQALKRARQ